MQGLEIEKLNGIIKGLNQKLKRNADLENEILSLRKGVAELDKNNKDLVKTVKDQAAQMKAHQQKNEKFQSLIIEENSNVNKLILEKEQQIMNHEKELNEYEQVAIAKDREINEIQLIIQDYESLK